MLVVAQCKRKRRSVLEGGMELGLRERGTGTGLMTPKGSDIWLFGLCFCDAFEDRAIKALESYSRCITTITPISPSMTVFSHGCSDSKIVT